MAQYRISRNIEASIMDRINEILTLCSFTGVTVLKSFAKVYQSTKPVICVRVGDTEYPRAEIGATSVVREVEVFIDIFAKTDGQRLDLKDCLIEYLKRNIDYYEYITVGGITDSKTKTGRLRVSDLSDILVNVNTDKNLLDDYDKFRSLITFNVDLGKIEV